MNSCKIVIEQVDVPEDKQADVGLAVSVKLKGASMTDKFLLMHSLRTALKLDALDVSIYAIAEMEGKFEHESQAIIQSPLFDMSEE